MIKKLLIVLLAASILLVPFTGCSGVSRENTLKIYNWADYIDESLKDDFKAYYEEKYDEKIDIKYETFDTNETMYIKVNKGKEDWDLACPSDYMIEKMLKEGLLKPLDTASMPYYGNVADFIKEQFVKIEEGNKAATDENIYSVGYMWGTMGILYKMGEDAIAEQPTSWEIMWDEQYQDKVFMKNSVRDTLGTAMIYVNREELMEAKGKEDYKNVLNAAYNTINAETLAAAEEALVWQKKNLNAVYDVDFDKTAMVDGKYLLDLAWSGDAVWAIIESADSDVNLGYAVPDEGSNLWFDGWVRPKYSEAKDQLVTEFVNFMCDPESAIRNMDEIGYVSAITDKEGESAILDYATESWLGYEEDGEEVEGYVTCFSQYDEDYTFDASYFFPNAGTTEFQINPIMYPSQDIIDRCAIMKGYTEEENELVLEMWAKVKGDTLSPFVIAALVLIVVGGFGVAVYFKLNSKKGKNKKVNGNRKKA